MGKWFWLGLVWGTVLGVVTAFGLIPVALPETPAAKTFNEKPSYQNVEMLKEVALEKDEALLPAKVEAPALPNAEKPVTQPKPASTVKLNEEIKPQTGADSDRHYSKTVPSVKPREEIKQEHKNKTLKNININFFGIENGVLQMLTVYSINKENGWKSGTVFVPTDGLVPGTKNTSFAEFYQTAGPLEIKKVLAEKMEIDIAYYVMVDRNLLLEMESYLEPIYVGGEKVNIAQIFTRVITPEDEIILASLLKSMTEPEVFWGVLPKLIWKCKNYIKTDFAVSCSNLWIHYQIAKNIDTTKVVKEVLPGSYKIIEGKRLWVVDPAGWYNAVYDVTR